ncbi:helix-turn-helix domain-containing protein [Patulibacter sp. NPDC049589]|uniref:helix-turn-helix domain-containing protein n=1 Tax=Patulibacter sp. NPDC049589 TaxID=3154731 RepID=UPI0034250253
MSSSLAAALLDELEDDALRELAERLRPFLPRDEEPRRRLLSTREASRQLGVHEGTLTRLAREGSIAGAQKLGRSWRFDLERVTSSWQPGTRRSVPATAGPHGRPSRNTQHVVDAIRGR